MAEVLKNTVKGGLALGGVEYLTGGKVSSVVLAIKDAVGGIISGTTNLPAITKVMPLAGKLAPFALAGNAVYSGFKEAKKTNSWNGIEKGLLTYGIPGVALGAIGLLSVPLSSQILLAGLGMYSAKKLYKAIADSVSIIKKSPSYISSLPGKAMNGIKKIKWPKKSNSVSTVSDTSATA